MNNEISSLPQTQLKRTPFGFVAIILLAAITYLFHKSALSGFWNNDDGYLMYSATRYSPWQYFFDPEISRVVTNSVNPWIVFIYDVNLWLFGFNPKGFYAHQLVSLWLASVATFFFLRLWVTSNWAFLGSLLFLAGAPTAYVANTLMTGHYLEGLIFMIIALSAYVKAVREQRWRRALIGALFYLLATCKEVYLPLIGILLFLPTGAHWKIRFRFSLPFGLVALFYILWRRQVLGAFIGGYRPDAAGYDPILIAKVFSNIPFLLLGDNIPGKVALSVIAMLIVFSVWRRRLNLKLLLISATLLLLPLVPIVLYSGIPMYPNIMTEERLMFVVWWGVAVFIAILLSTHTTNNGKYIMMAIGLFLAGVTINQYYKKQINYPNPHEKMYQFILNSNSSQVYIPFHPNIYFAFILDGIVKAEKLANPLSPQRARIMKVEDELEHLDLEKTSVWTYDISCNCNKDVSATVPGMVLEFKEKQREMPLSLQVEFKPYVLIWEAGPYNEGDYELVFIDYGVYPAQKKWSWVWLLEFKEVNLYLRYKSPEGWITRSPVFHLKPSSAVTWSR